MLLIKLGRENRNMNYEEFKKYVDKMNENIFNKLKDNNDEQFFYVQLVKRFNEICSEQLESEQQVKKQKEVIDKAIEYIESNSNIYLNIMGNKIGFFNENDGYTPIELLDILNEVSE